MDNPFRKRATEFLREDEAFLAIVTPEPIRYFLSEPGKEGRLYDRLVLLRGTPGSGKTTLARLFEFPTFHTLTQNKNFEGHKDICAALVSCGAMRDELPQVLGFRLPLETGYRDFWEFSYSENLKSNLMIALLQARAVLGWFRHLSAAGVATRDVTIITRPEASGVVDTIGGTGGEEVRSQAGRVENAIYQVMNALVAPPEEDLPSEAVDAYRPFDIIDRIAIPHPPSHASRHIELRPLAIFDDAHVLHPEQFRALEKFLLRRDLRVARWMIARFDILLPQEALAAVSEEASAPARFAGVSADREAEVILLQSTRDRLAHRSRFRKMSKDMADRYLRRMPLLNERGLVNLANLLGDAEVSVRPSALDAIRRNVNATQKRLGISPAVRQRFEGQITGFSKADSEEVALYMLRIMMHRFDNRRSRRAPGLFDDGDQPDVDVRVAANDSVYAAALFQLFHERNRPYYYSIDSLCDTSSENAEQFLQLAAELVEAIVTQAARGKSVLLSPDQQHSLLRQRGERIMEGWRFPRDDKVKRLVRQVAQRCLKKSLEPNGAVIANAIGIPQEEFVSLATDYPELAAVLQFAIAYNAISLAPNHPCKNRMWCLFELGGMVLLRYGLTSRRGGFVESDAAEVSTFLREKRQ